MDMTEIKLPAIDLTKANLLFERRASGLYVPVWQEGVAGAANVAQNGAVTATAGAQSLRVLNAHAAADGQAGDNYITDTTGWKGFMVDPLQTLATDVPVLIAYSTDPNVQADLEITLDAVNSAITDGLTPPGNTTPVDYAGVGVISINTKELPVFLWDGTTTIKTIALMMAGAGADNTCAVTLIS